MRKFLVSALCVMSAFVSASAMAKVIYLAPGDSQQLNFDEKIGTIFVTNPNVANYKVLGDKSLLLYAKQEGETQLDVLSREGEKSLLKSMVSVTELGNLTRANEQIKIQFPNSQLHIVKMGKAYVIEGKAATEEELQTVQRIVAAAVDSKSERVDRDLDKDGLGKDLLTKYTYDNVINNATITKPNQINVRLSVVEIDRNLAEKLGVSWDNLTMRMGDVLKAPWTWVGSFSGASGAAVKFTAGSMSGFINALNSNDNAKVLAEPNLSMLSGEKASVLIGGQIPFIQYDRQGNPTVIYKDYGIDLNVAAKVQTNGRIRIALQQAVTDVLNKSVQGIPVLATTSSKSIFELANGESFIIGGLYNKRQSQAVSKVPFLGDIPVLGAFFRDTSQSKQEKELLIVATVHLVNPVQEENIDLPDFEVAGTLENFFNLTPLKKVYERTQVTNFLQRGGFIQ
ncbi:hypothetical protein A6A19_01840 [Actinobacillus delphinicola]|uniref:Rough colony protein A n=1 Tax=Actinobacillus delphinicola TaxID=51161 RepID=A0A448TW97_9PAST|nr:pilus assembly protein N-terminal domain-containing protein [Actinobacillus delphinicola]MDG6896769.1 hypothetical protein [Actinobacillus delphinicola]VEJ10201.1 rough colony protein A [Actinobacillus delphinicola]